MNNNEYIPLWKYALINKLKYHTVYRWYRQHQFKRGDTQKKKKEVKRILIKITAKKIK